MMTPHSPEPPPSEMEEQLSHLLGQWAHGNRLSTTKASRIREAVQESDSWNQSFWTRMSTVLIPSLPVVEHVPAQPWNLTWLISTDLAQIVSQSKFDDPGSYPYLCLHS